MPDPAQPLERRAASVRRGEVLLCAVVFLFLIAWASLFRHTGDADATFHYLDARVAWVDPGEMLSAWDRPLFKFFLMVPARLGVLPARTAMAALFAVLMWQTIQWARELRIERPILAGVLLILQPTVFGLASDTMTELPMALGIVIAVRMWQRGAWLKSCLVTSLLPMIRPEGFWLCAMWGVMVRFTTAAGPIARRIGLAASLTTGTLLWMAACWSIRGDALWFIRVWSWPVETYAAYGRGPLWHHVVRWPVHLGAVLTVLWIAGIRPSARERSMRLPWEIWLLIFGLHSILFWRGWFASLGLMRIMATTAPVTALVCLFGWNRMSAWLEGRGWRERQRRRLATATLSLATAIVLAHYLLLGQHLRTFPLQRAVAHLRQHDLIATAPAIVVSDKTALAEMALPLKPDNVLDPGYSAAELREKLRAMPIGTIGIWDNQRALQWYGISINELTGMGYDILKDETQTAMRQPKQLLPVGNWFERQRYYAIRKTR